MKFSCHPIIEIALERTLTEAAQGVGLDNYVNRKTFQFLKNDNDNLQEELLNGFKIGTMIYPHEFLKSDLETNDKFFDLMSKDLSNREMLKRIYHTIQKDGWEILIRNVSYLDFPVFHIIIPGMSELSKYDVGWIEAKNTKYHIGKLLGNMELISVNNLKYIINTMDYFSKIFNESHLESYNYNYDFKNMIGEDIELGWLYITIVAFMMLKDWDNSLRRLNLLIHHADALNSTWLGYYQALKNYCEGSNMGLSHYEIISYLRMFHSDKIILEIESFFEPDTNFLYNHNKLIISKDNTSFKELMVKYKKNQKKLSLDIYEKLNL